MNRLPPSANAAVNHSCDFAARSQSDSNVTHVSSDIAPASTRLTNVCKASSFNTSKLNDDISDSCNYKLSRMTPLRRPPPPPPPSCSLPALSQEYLIYNRKSNSQTKEKKDSTHLLDSKDNTKENADIALKKSSRENLMNDIQNPQNILRLRKTGLQSATVKISSTEICINDIKGEKQQFQVSSKNSSFNNSETTHAPFKLGINKKLNSNAKANCLISKNTASEKNSLTNSDANHLLHSSQVENEAQFTVQQKLKSKNSHTGIFIERMAPRPTPDNNMESLQKFRDPDGLENRFFFIPISELPLPSKFLNSVKSYPSLNNIQ